MLRRLLSIAVLAALATTAPSRAEPPADGRLVMVAHPGVTAESLSQYDVQRIYLGKDTRWKGGLAIRPVMLRDHVAQAWFVTDVLERSLESFSVYWKRMIFSGKGRPPRAFDVPAELAAYVRQTPGAIGFLPAGADVSGLRVLDLE